MGNEHIVSWEPEGRYCRSKMFPWEPEGRYCHWFCTAIAPFWFSREHLWSAIAPFWLSSDDIPPDSMRVGGGGGGEFAIDYNYWYHNRGLPCSRSQMKLNEMKQTEMKWNEIKWAQSNLRNLKYLVILFAALWWWVYVKVLRLFRHTCRAWSEQIGILNRVSPGLFEDIW